MLQGQFERLENEEIESLIPFVNETLQDISFDAKTVSVLRATLPFYEEYCLLDIFDHQKIPSKRVLMLYSKKHQDIRLLDWSNTPIYKLNEEAPIFLDADNVDEYVRFFFSLVRGKHGKFVVAENVDDVPWRDEPPPAARKAMSKMIIPVTLKNINKEGTFELETTMVFRDSLFQADIQVQKDGLTSLSNEKLLIEDMPVLDETFGH